MRKGERIERYVQGMGASGAPAGVYDPCYSGYFTCFNAQEYYEAHDVLEHLWLKTTGPESQYFKGLIQFAGAFVHLKKQFTRPHHPKDSGRMRPAARLFRIAASNLQPFAPTHMDLDVDSVIRTCLAFAGRIETSEYLRNPWDPLCPPQLSPAPSPTAPQG